MQRHAETLRRLGQGQRVRLRFDDDHSRGMRASQMEYHPGERLRIELTSDDLTDDGRYRATTHVEDGEWTPIHVERYDPGAGEWTRLADVRDVTPLSMFRTMKSADMDAQASTGTEGWSER